MKKLFIILLILLIFSCSVFVKREPTVRELTVKKPVKENSLERLRRIINSKNKGELCEISHNGVKLYIKKVPSRLQCFFYYIIIKKYYQKLEEEGRIRKPTTSPKTPRFGEKITYVNL